MFDDIDGKYNKEYSEAIHHLRFVGFNRGCCGNSLLGGCGVDEKLFEVR